MDVHNALSHLVFAVDQALEPFIVEVKAEWQSHTYLSVEVGCYGRNVQPIADRLCHGVLQGPYDYRFRVSHPMHSHDDEWTWVKAYPDLQHDDRKFRSKT